MEEFTRIIQPPLGLRFKSRLTLGPTARGIGLMLASCLLFAFMFTLPRLVGTELSGLQVAFIRYVTGFLAIAPIVAVLVLRGRRLTTTALPIIALRAVCGVGGVSCVVYATTHMAYADAIAIGFADGVFILVLAALVLGEKVSRQRWLAAGACLLGAVIVAQPSPELLGRVLMEPAAGVAFLGAFIMAGEVIVIKHLSNRLSAVQLTFYTNVLAVLIAAVPALALGDWPPIRDFAWLGLMGPIAIAGQFLFILSMRQADVSALVPYKYSTLVYAGLLGILLFGQWPDMLSAVGIIIIIVAGVRLSRAESGAAAQPRSRAAASSS